MGCWKGIATVMLAYLKHDLDDSQAALLPKIASVLCGELTELAPAMRTAGISARTWKISEIKAD